LCIDSVIGRCGVSVLSDVIRRCGVSALSETILSTLQHVASGTVISFTLETLRKNVSTRLVFSRNVPESEAHRNVAIAISVIQ